MIWIGNYMKLDLNMKLLWCRHLGLVEKGIDFNVTWNAFIKKHESILQRSQAFRGSA